MTVIAAGTSTATAWFTLAGALGGVLLTSAVALTTAILNHRWQMESKTLEKREERAKRRREDQREVYARYWKSQEQYRERLAEANSSRQEVDIGSIEAVRLPWLEAYYEVILIGNESVHNYVQVHARLLDTLLQAVVANSAYSKDDMESYEKATSRLLASMRAEIENAYESQDAEGHSL
jgi:hypothetical protein